MKTLTRGISFLDLEFQGRPNIIASVVLQGAGGVAIIDPGPASTLPALRRALGASGITLRDVTDILLTHIHLDHAGATGTIVRERPDVNVWVHEVGAPHLVSPEKLLASATRLYGDAMDRLWGEVRPVPKERVRTLAGGERVAAGGRNWDVKYTPGHASHHVSFFDEASGIAFAGDTAGVRLPGRVVLPPTPPPDIDLDRWEDSLAAIEAWRPETLFVTHFGPSAPVGTHLSEMRAHLQLVARLGKESLAHDGTDAERAAWFSDSLRGELRRRGLSSDGYEFAAPFDLNWRGIARYWLKKGKK